MRKLSILFVILLATQIAQCKEFSIAKSMRPKKNSDGALDKTRILLGPGIGVNAFNRGFAFNLNPSLAYAFTDNFYAGFSLGYSYFQQSTDYRNPVSNLDEKFRYKIPSYSASVFARYIIANMIIIGVEPEINNTKVYTDKFSFNSSGQLNVESRRLSVSSFLVGGGYCQRQSDIGHLFFMAMYDLRQNPNAARYYESLDIRLGWMIPLFNQR